MRKQSKIIFESTPRGRSSKTADKAPDADRPSTSREHLHRVDSRPRAQSALTSSQSTEPTMNLVKDFTDSTDWIPTSLPAFSPLEAALRCEVCKEFYNNPVITTCAHTFCSLCIRRCIAADGKCPACKSICQADKLMTNIAVREVVTKWQDARKDALELASRDKENTSESGKKRKLNDTDLEETQEPGRQTRSRSTRSGRRAGSQKTYDEPVVVPDSEEEEDEYLPNGLVKCPICKSSMKEALMFDHVGSCTGEKVGRTTQSRKTNAFPKTMQVLPKEVAPLAARLSGFNYALLTEAALKKRLKELGIPNKGPKPILIKRHQEWLNIFNSNCDAADNVRKTKRELLKDLDDWERAQGAHASNKESTIMRKDFDGAGHATTHKSQFDDLIKQARAKAKAGQRASDGLEPTVQASSVDTPRHEEQGDAAGYQYAQQTQNNPPDGQSQQYQDNEAALSDMRPDFEEANMADRTHCSQKRDSERSNTSAAHETHTSSEPTGLQSFASPSKKAPMFALSAESLVDVENPSA